MAPDRALVARFAADLDSLIAPGARIGLAVSGGPDSLALLLLAAAARPGAVAAATVDHGLRPDSAGEAKIVSAICDRLSVPHSTLPIEWTEPPQSNLQARARSLRYDRLADWFRQQGLGAVATGHHADDQAETLLMRMGRGSGLSGLSGIRPTAELRPGVTFVRPLLRWRRSELAAIVADAGLVAVDDLSNRDPRHDRTRARSLLAAMPSVDPLRLAEAAHHLQEADQALDWATGRLAAERLSRTGCEVHVRADGLPRDIQRRLLLHGFAELHVTPPPGPELSRALEALRNGQTVTLAGIKLQGGATWRLAPAPPRR